MRHVILGRDALNRELVIPPEERQAHMHVIGSSGSGKSKFLESMMRQDLVNRQGFCLIDPHGTLFRDVLNYCAHRVFRREIVILDLSDPKHIVGFNPFRRRTAGDVSVQVDRRIAATMHAWGVDNTDETPTLERTLRLIYTALIEQNLSFHHSQYLIDFNSQQIRAALIKDLTSPLVKREWEELQQLKAKDWRSEVLSAKNRLFRLLTSKTLARFLNASTAGLDIAEIIEQGKVLLVNLAPSDYLSAENARVFGALLVNEFFEVGRRRIPRRGQTLTPYYLYMDEFQTFVSLDITKMLDQVRKYGLFCVLAHQRFGQLDMDISDAVLTNCRIKAVFGGLPVESARMMAQEMFIGDLDPMKIKVAIYQTKFWPTYARDKVYTHATSGGESFGKGKNRASGTASGAVSGQFFLPGDWFSAAELSGSSIVHTSSSSQVFGSHSNETIFTGEVSGVADVPILLPVPFQELSSLQFFTPEEQLIQLTAALKEQFGRHCFIKIHHQKTQPMAVPFVTSFYPPRENFKWYLDQILSSAHAHSAAEVDAGIAQEEQRVNASLAMEATVAALPKRAGNTGWEDIMGRE